MLPTILSKHNGIKHQYLCCFEKLQGGLVHSKLILLIQNILRNFLKGTHSHFLLSDIQKFNFMHNVKKCLFQWYTANIVKNEWVPNCHKICPLKVMKLDGDNYKANYYFHQVWWRSDKNCLITREDTAIFLEFKDHNQKVPRVILLIIELDQEIMPINIFNKFGEDWTTNFNLDALTINVRV